MKKFLITLSLVVISLPAIAQENTSGNEKNVEKSILNNSIEFMGDWRFIDQGDRYLIKGEAITNHSSHRTKNLKLNIFLVPKAEYTTFDFSTNKSIKNISLGRIAGNGSSVRNIKIDFKANFAEKLPDGQYVPVLIIDNLVMSRKVLNDLHIKNGKIDQQTLHQPAKNVEPKQAESTSNFEQKGFQFKPIVTSNKAEEDVFFEGKIKLEINQKDYKVILISEGGHLVNNAKEDNPVKVRVVLVKDLKENEDGKGFNIAEYSLDNVPAQTKFANFTFQTNLLRLIPKGKYTPVLMIAKEENGEYLFKSSYVFDKEIEIKN
ncbi:hypothetical protein QP519_06035 [Weeksella virosa]|uniref:hypothetical protein n=1 Tax=Weeksella virosa TaxID=1014 RepID=UPI0025573231|nr:hypothetical protein [Weeksella virosa]MDK7375097.1 hypothetical protein [Weeksella virosa]